MENIIISLKASDFKNYTYNTFKNELYLKRKNGQFISIDALLALEILATVGDLMNLTNWEGIYNEGLDKLEKISQPLFYS